MSADLLNKLLDGPFELTARPDPLPGDLRLSWGIALVLLILAKSRGKKASLQKLHFVAHSIRTKQSRTDAQQVFAGERHPADILVRVEPWLNRALAFARGAGLVDVEGGKAAKLTAVGQEVADRVLHDETVFVEEKAFLSHVGSRATEGAIEKIMRMEVLL
jgi:hypothetical protein